MADQQRRDGSEACGAAPAVTARVSVEQASTLGWCRYVGPQGQSIGMKTFGASAPLKEVQKKFGFVPEHVVTAAKELLAKSKGGT